VGQITGLVLNEETRVDVPEVECLHVPMDESRSECGTVWTQRGCYLGMHPAHFLVPRSTAYAASSIDMQFHEYYKDWCGN
jgi:hypothetical protein